MIPLMATTMISTQPSPVDPMEEQMVLNWLSSEPITGVVSQSQATSAPTDSAIVGKSDPTGFGMFFNVLEELAPLAIKGLSLL